MAESNNKSGFLALAHKRLSRTKTKVLQNLGKADKTTDDLFNENVLKVEKQQEVAHRLHKEVKSYIHCLQEMSLASKSLTTMLLELYEPDWTKEAVFKAQLQTLDLLWGDFLQKMQDSVVMPIHIYLQSFPVLKTKIAKRGRKLVDYDNCRHHLEVLLSAKKKDEVKLHKAQEEVKEAKTIYEELNNELHTDLPEFNSSRVTFVAGLLSSLFGAEYVFHSQVGKVNQTLDDLCQELGKDFEHFVYQPRTALSKSMSSYSGENGFSEEVSEAGSPINNLTRASVGSANGSSVRDLSQPVYSNQEVLEQKQRVSCSLQQNTSSPELQETRNTQRSGQEWSNQDDGGRNTRELQAIVHNVYEEPKEAAPTATSSTSNVSSHRPESGLALNSKTETDSDDYTSSDDEQEDQEPVYSNPPSKQPLTTPPPNTLYMVQATHTYTGEDVDELSFEPGEIIYVIEFSNPEEQDEGWQMGIKASDGVLGVFPENFTQKYSANGR